MKTIKPIPAPKLRVRFSKLPRNDRIKIVAKDALARFKAKQLSLSPGDLVKIEDDDMRGNDVQTHILAGRPCAVCALGAAACSIAAIEDRMSFRFDLHHSDYRLSLSEGEGIETRLRRLFGRELMKTIEAVFEQGTGAFQEDDESDLPWEAIHAFGKKHESHEARFLAIYRTLARTGDFTL